MKSALQQLEEIAKSLEEREPTTAFRLREVAADLRFPVKIASEAIDKTSAFYQEPADVQPALFGRLRAACAIFLERIDGRDLERAS